MAIRAHDAVADRPGVVPVGSADVRPRRRSLTLRREGQLAYILLTPTLLVLLLLVAYPFVAAVYMSLQNKMVGAPGRWVGLDVYNDRAQRTPSDFLAAVIEGYPSQDHTVEHIGPELRHAFWLSEVIDGNEEQVFHGHVVRPGSMLSVRVVHRFPADRAWAQHVLNSVQYVGET